MVTIMKVLTILVASTFAFATFAPRGGAALECTDVVQYINPCIPYVTGRTGLGTCCSSLRGLYGAAQTTPDRRTVCNCLKSLTNGYSGDQIHRAAGLPGQCNIHIPYRIDPSTNCARVH